MTLISNHSELAKSRLLEQFKRKPKLAALIDAIIAPIQDIENELQNIELDRALDSAIGYQLDLLGTIVGAVRAIGETDDDFRATLRATIVENISQGEPERMISIYKTLVGAALVVLDDDAFGGVGLMSEVSLTDQDFINLVFRRIEVTAAAGVRVDFIGHFDAAEPFSFSGNLPASGFGSVTDAGVGGKFAHLYINKNTLFSFDGTNFRDGGFGTIQDGLIGGLMTGL